MSKILYNRIELVTPEQAMDWLTGAQYEHQRPRSAMAVEDWKRIIETGQFRQGSQIRFCVNGNGKEALVDGQHRLEAIFETGLPQELSVLCLKVDTPEELSQEYAYSDILGRRRTAAQSFVALGACERFGLTRTQVDMFGSALSVILAGFNSPTSADLDRKRVWELMPAWADAMVRYVHLVADSSITKKLFRRGCLSVALATMRYAPAEKAVGFWKQVAFDDGLALRDPRKTLNKFLLSKPVLGSETAGVKVNEETRLIANAWNAFVDGRELHHLVTFRPSAAIEIKLTPYGGA